jgi:hypothetical protein
MPGVIGDAPGPTNVQYRRVFGRLVGSYRKLFGYCRLVDPGARTEHTSSFHILHSHSTSQDLHVISTLLLGTFLSFKLLIVLFCYSLINLIYWVTVAYSCSNKQEVRSVYGGVSYVSRIFTSQNG